MRLVRIVGYKNLSLENICFYSWEKNHKLQGSAKDQEKLIRYPDPGLQDSLKISVGKFWMKMHYQFLCEPLMRKACSAPERVFRQ